MLRLPRKIRDVVGAVPYSFMRTRCSLIPNLSEAEALDTLNIR